MHKISPTITIVNQHPILRNEIGVEVLYLKVKDLISTFSDADAIDFN